MSNIKIIKDGCVFNMINGIDTPSLVVDLDQLEKNIKDMAAKAKERGINLRPHIKTHKSPQIACKQLEAGAVGVTVAKIGEAEVMVQNGIEDILIAFPIVGQKKLKRLKELVKKAKIMVSLDSLEVAKGISEVGNSLGKAIPVYVEVDTGLGRVGRKHGEDSLEMIEAVAQLPNIKIQGLMTHAGHSYKHQSLEEIKEISRQEGEYLVQTRDLVYERLGLYIPTISVGSTPTSYIGGQVSGVNEMRPGTYVFNDATMVSLGLVEQKDCALSIYATVVSRPAPDRAIIDAGSKTLTSDRGAFTNGFGVLKDSPGVCVSWLSEEHGVIYLPDNFDLKIGDLIEIIPNHVCPTVNLTDELIGVRGGEISEIIPVQARGKNK